MERGKSVMLRLSAPTRPEWLPEALNNIDVILLDHAHCEKKAASTAMNLIFRYHYREDLMRPLSELAREELRHFELMLGVLAKRGIKYERMLPSAYATKLYAEVRKGEPDRFVDTMICCALIEARSCERMQLLSEGLEDRELAQLYSGLLASEARHHQTYLDLAIADSSKEAVNHRLKELSEHEAQILTLSGEPIRLHS